MFKPADLFDLTQTEHAAIFDGCQFAWEALKKIEPYIAANLKPALHNKCEGRAFIGKKVFIGAGTVIEDGVMIKGPAIIGKNCQIRHNAYFRENVIIGDGAEAGCNAVLNPGSILGCGAVIYPNVFWRGILPANTIAKNKAEIEVVVKRPREI